MRTRAGAHNRVTASIHRLAGLALTAVVFAGGCGGKPEPRVVPPPSTPGARAPRTGAVSLVRVRILVNGRARTLALPIEEYVLASALSEVAPSRNEPEIVARAFELQAIVARTYAVASRGRHAAEGFDLCDTTHCQVVDLERPNHSRWANVARAAVDRTRGKILYYGGAPASALYHADCGGYRASASDVWGGAPVPYLLAEPDPLPGGRTHVSWTYTVDRQRLRGALNANPRTAVGERLDTVEVQSRDPSGRARLVVLNGARAPLVRGEGLRTVLTAAFGARALRSTRFEVRREGQRFVFTGHGFGHGVGLCQTGALARAAAGESVDRILAFYYPNTRLR